MLAFLNPRVWLALVIVGAVGFVGGFWKGYQYADRKAEVAALQSAVNAANAVIAEQQRQAEAGRAIAEADAARKQRDDSEATVRNEQVETYVSTLPPERPDNLCALSADDVRMLNAIIRSGRAPKPPGVPH